MSSSLEPLRLSGRPSGVRLLPEQGQRQAVIEAALERARAEGRAEAEAGLLAVLSKRLEVAAEESNAADLELRDDFAQSACQLAVALAERLVCAKVDAGEHNVEGIVRQALSQSLPDPAGLTVRLHPSESLALSKVDFSSEVHFEPDKSLSPGDVVIESSHGRLVRALRELVDDLAENLPEQFAK